jgi:ABC-type polar amino acid transport system ATPase subunit
MSRVVFDTFELHQCFMKTTNVTIGIFEVHNIISATMANQVKVVLNSIGLLDNVITYIEDEGFNLTL